MNRKTPKEVIEKGNPKTEQAYVKFPREEPIKVSEEEDENAENVLSDLLLIPREARAKKFYHIHTHVYKNGSFEVALPSGRDLYNLRNQIENLPNFKGGIIAQRSADSREVQGYTILSKGKKNIFEGLGKDKKFLGLFKTKKKVTYKDLINKYEQKVNQYHLMAHVNPTFAHNKLNNICKEYGWGLRFVPAKGYHFNRETGNFEKNKGAGLEKVIASIIGISILLFALFNVVNINGFVVNNTNSLHSVNLVWILIIFLLGISFFVVRRVKK